MRLLAVPRGHVWRWYAVAAAAVIVLEQVAGKLDSASTPTQFALSLFISASVVAAICVGIRVHRPQDRLTWYLVLGSQVLFFLGDVAFFVTRDVLLSDLFPGPSDVLYLARYGLLIAAMVRMIRARSAGNKTADRVAVIDAIVITAGVSVLSWMLWVGASVTGVMPTLTRATILALPLMDLAVFALAVRTVVGRGQQVIALRLLYMASFLLFVADSVYLWQLTNGSYRTHNFIDVLWNGHSVLMAVMVLHPSMVRICTPSQEVSVGPFKHGRFLAMAAASGLCPALLIVNGASDRDLNEIVIGVVTIVMFASVVMRAYLASANDARAHEALLAKREELAEVVEALRVTEHERTQLLQAVIRAGEQERVWIAAEIHDGPIQQLSACGFGIDRVRRRLAAGDTPAAADALEQTRDQLTTIVDGLRKLMSELRPPALDEAGIDGALRDYVADFGRESGIGCSIEIDLGGERLASEIETTLYRVSQEALQNVRRHSHAKHAVLSLTRSDEGFRLEVQDDGCGFDVAAPLPGGVMSHYGLIGMRERVEQSGGSLCVRSAPGSGTTIDAQFPFARYQQLQEVS